MVKNLVTAIAIVGVSLGTIGVLQSPMASANNGNTVSVPEQTDAAKNNTTYWEAMYPGSTCVKYDGLSDKSFTITADMLPAGNQFTAAIVKAGSSASLDGQDPNEVDTSVKVGDVLTHSSGKDLSHVILCYKPVGGSGGGGETPTTPVTPTTTTPTTPTTPVGGSGNSSSENPIVVAASGASRPAATQQVTSLPVTSGASDKLAALIVMAGSVLASIGAYVVRMRSAIQL